MNDTVPSKAGVWLALADAEGCRLLWCGATDDGAMHLEERAGMLYEQPQHSRGNPRAHAIRKGNTAVALGYEAAKHCRRVAYQIAVWLARSLAKQRVDRVFVLAPPKLLGSLRRAPWGPLTRCIVVREGGFMHLRASQLAEHPAILRLLPAA